jgi:CRISPR/Cas system CMR-associated protein Cmr5 small subunit
MISFAKAPDYILKYNNMDKSIEFRVYNEFILSVLNTSRVYNIYREKDVEELLQILSAKLKGESIYTEIDINKMYVPPKIYINNTYEATLMSHIWKDEKKNILDLDKNINEEELLKNKEPVINALELILSINSDISKNELVKLPVTAKVMYAIHKDGKIILTKEAERMVNGSYHLDIPNIKGEYIYVVNLTFTDLPNVEAMYYFKYKI